MLTDRRLLMYMTNGCSLFRYAGHTAQCGSARFHPGAFMSQSRTAVNVASCSHDGGVLLWSLEKETPLLELENHGDRVSRVAFHPSGKYLASAWSVFSLNLIRSKRRLLLIRVFSVLMHHGDCSILKWERNYCIRLVTRRFVTP